VIAILHSLVLVGSSGSCTDEITLTIDTVAAGTIGDFEGDIDDLGLLYKVDLLHYEEKQGTPIGDHIERIGKVFFSREA